MDTLSLSNAFSAPVYHAATVSSTMDAAREIAAQEVAPHGTVVVADEQTAGRGRIRERQWVSAAGNLYCTILLRYGGFAEIPKALTLKTGLAVINAACDFIASRGGRLSTRIKWPNDLMTAEKDSGIWKKTTGIACESDGNTVFIGIGVNVAQRDFPQELSRKAASLASASGLPLTADDRWVLLEKILSFLKEELERSDDSWRERLVENLYRRGERVCFIPGAALSGEPKGADNLIEGVIMGVDDDGALLIRLPDGREEAFISGELRVYDM